jgi:oligo-1,6-glucosidase/alpha-glucosidase
VIAAAAAKIGDELAWWQRTTVYQIYPRSFADANGDGIGDLPGILDRLDHLRDLGVETLWLSPFFASPQRDFGYDVADYDGIAPEYGTMADCERLIEAVHARGMKIVLDLVLNHTSDQHPWFLASRRGEADPMRAFYIWRKGRKPGGAAPPNNWVAMTGGSGWHYDAATDAWYWASFLPFQPDLNYHNPAVREAMLGVVRRWLERGADGFRLDIFNALFKDPRFFNNPFSLRPLPSETSADGFFQRRLYTADLPETFAFARDLRALVDSFPGHRFLVGEVFGTPEKLRRYCGSPEGPGLHTVFLFQTLRAKTTAPALRALIAELEREFPPPHIPTYVLGNHDQLRAMSRLAGHEGKARLLAALTLTVRGIPFVYYGEEIGMPGVPIPLREGLDPLAARYSWVSDRMARLLARAGVCINRDESRTPMAWSPDPGAGFCPPGVEPWRPFHKTYPRVNVASEEGDPSSMLACYRRLLALRKTRPALHAGSLDLLESERAGSLVGYRRRARDGDVVDVWLNASDRPEWLLLSEPSPTMLFSTHRFSSEPMALPSSELHLMPYEAVVLDKSGR